MDIFIQCSLKHENIQILREHTKKLLINDLCAFLNDNEKMIVNSTMIHVKIYYATVLDNETVQIEIYCCFVSLSLVITVRLNTIG